MQIINEDFQKIGNDAVRKVQRKSLENGVIYFQLPDGIITMENPFKKMKLNKEK